jgi:hypothetical protein
VHARRVICLVLGLWLGATAAVAWIARENRFAGNISAERDPVEAAAVQTLGKPAAEWLLRHQAAAQNRRLYETWGEVQVVMGSVFLLFVLFGSQEGKLILLLLLLMLATVVLQLFVLAPELTALDRAAAETARSHWAAMGDRAAELLKACLGLALALKLTIRRRGSGYSGNDLDLIDKPDHRHVNG